MATVLNGTRRITTHEAQVKTASVEVKALTISGKQVTLSVFRQLQEEDLIDYNTAQLRGVPWGRVNYFWGECKPNHLHVVWQKGEELRRSCVYPPKGNIGVDVYWRADSPAYETKETVSALLRDLTIWCIAAKTALPGGGRWDARTKRSFEIRSNGEWVSAEVPADAYELFQHRYEGKKLYPFDVMSFLRERNAEVYIGHDEIERLYAMDLHERERARLATFARQYGTREALEQRLMDTTAAMQAHRARYKATYEALGVIDQLFIAV